MNLDPKNLAIAASLTVAFLWTICSILVALLPSGMMTISGHMIHANLDQIGWTMTPFGFFVGLVAWSLLTGVSVWTIASIYNRLSV